MLRILTVLLIIQLFMGLSVVNAETIYTKDGRVITAKISEKSENTIWYEVSIEADVIEYTGIDISEVERILNDDGTPSKYSPV